MAVKDGANQTGTNQAGGPKQTFSGRHFVVGANVTLMIVLMVALLVFVQWVGFRYVDARVDMTSTGVNSLTPGTERLFEGLEGKVRLTSLYFKTDLEEEDQAKYRTAVVDLFTLLQGQNKSKVEIDFVNPLQDHEKRERLFARLKELTAYQDEAKDHQAVIEKYKTQLSGQIAQACTENENKIAGFMETDAVFKSNPQAQQVGQQLRLFFRQFTRQIEEIRSVLDELEVQDLPQYTGAINTIKELYKSFAEGVDNVVKFVDSASERIEGLGAETKTFLLSLKDQLPPIAEQLKAEKTKADGLKDLKLEKLLSDLRGETRNQIVVETDAEAKVISFSDTWPAMNPDQAGPRTGFAERNFNGEAMIASAVLGLTQNERAAVVFTRFGGSNPFFGRFGQQQSGPTYRTLKEQLERANFTVHDWDVATNKEGPKIDPAPSRIIYLVLRPTSPPPPNPMQPRPPQQPQFNDESRNAILAKIKKSGRALFLAGWKQPAGPYGMPSMGDYEFKDYLSKTWGLEVLQNNVVMNAFSYEPGKWAFRQQDAFNVNNDKYEIKDHVITGALSSLPASFFQAVPLKYTDAKPEGVTIRELITVPAREDMWGEENIQGLIEEIRRQNFTRKDEKDISGPFPLAVVCEKDKAKILVVGSEGFATDRVANARAFLMGGGGRLIMRSANPGNIPFLVNACHWLNDNTAFMDVGRPVEVSRLKIAKGGTLSFWHAFAWGIWPAMALLCGGGVWFSRRR